MHDDFFFLQAERLNNVDAQLDKMGAQMNQLAGMQKGHQEQMNDQHTQMNELAGMLKRHQEQMNDQHKQINLRFDGVDDCVRLARLRMAL